MLPGCSGDCIDYLIHSDRRCGFSLGTAREAAVECGCWAQFPQPRAHQKKWVALGLQGRGLPTHSRAHQRQEGEVVTDRGWGWAPGSSPGSTPRQWRNLGSRPHLSRVPWLPRYTWGNWGHLATARRSSVYTLCVCTVNPHKPLMGDEVLSFPLYRRRN